MVSLITTQLCEISMKITIYGPDLEIMRQNMAKMGKIWEKRDFWKTTKTHLLLQKSSVWAKNHTRTAWESFEKRCYLAIIMTGFHFWFFRETDAWFFTKRKLDTNAVANVCGGGTSEGVVQECQSKLDKRADCDQCQFHGVRQDVSIPRRSLR